MSDFEIQWQTGQGDKAARLELSGKVNLHNCRQVVSQGIRHLESLSHSDRLVINIENVGNSQSVLFSVLLRWLSAAEAGKIDMSITGLSGKMFEVARVSGVDTVLPLSHSG